MQFTIYQRDIFKCHYVGVTPDDLRYTLVHLVRELNHRHIGLFALRVLNCLYTMVVPYALLAAKQPSKSIVVSVERKMSSTEYLELIRTVEVLYHV